MKLRKSLQIDLTRLIPIGAIVSVILAIIMAWQSPAGSSPDELMHLEAGTYYLDHWLPPRVGDPELNYDPWGGTRLDQLGIDHFLGGKLAYPMIIAGIPETQALRLTSCLVFAALLTWLCIRHDTRIIALPLLITSQVWYIFSYLNDDSLPLALAFVAVQQICWNGSSFRRSLFDLRLRQKIIKGLPLGLALGLLFISKTNYLPFAILAAVGSAITSYTHSAPSRRLFAIAIPLLIAAIVVAGRYSIDFGINGTARGELIEAQREAHAWKAYKPSTLRDTPELSHEYLQLRNKGVTFSQVIGSSYWLTYSAASFAGTYGGMDIWAPKWFYLIIGIFYAGIAIALLMEAISRRRSAALTKIASFFLFATVSVLASAYFSWTWDWQTQGRYLFPILPAFAALIAIQRGILDRLLMQYCSIGAWLWSCTSFIAIGLRNLAL